MSVGGCSRAAIRPATHATWPACAQGKRHARACGLAAEVCHDTIICIVIGGRPSVATQRSRGYDTAQQRPATRHRSATTRATRRAVCAAGTESQYKFLYLDQGAKATALRHGSVRARHDLRHGQCTLRHGHNTALCAHSQGPLGVRTVHSTQF